MTRMTPRPILLCLVLLAAVAAHAQSDDAAYNSKPAGLFHEDNPAAVAALARFNRIAEPATSDLPSRNTISENNCEGSLSPSCIRWVLHNPNLALMIVVDDEEYWSAYSAYLKTSPVGVSSDLLALDDSGANPGSLIKAANAWPIHQLAKFGRLDTDKAAEHLRDVRRLGERSGVLIDRMIFSALIGIQINTVNLALAQATLEDDQPALRNLALATTRLSERERSIRRAFDGELRYGQRMLELRGNTSDPVTHYETQLANRAALLTRHNVEFELPQMMTRLELEEEQAQSKAERQATKRIMGLSSQISELSPIEFWGGHELWVQANEAARESTFFWSYANYLSDIAMRDIALAVANELSEHRRQPHPTPTPLTSPPMHFAWEWRDSKDELCLVPTTVNQFLADKAYPVCLPAWTSAPGSLIK